MKGRYVVLALFILFMGTGLSPAHAGTEPSCLECHGSEGLDMTFKNGEIAALFVDYGKFQESIHSFLECAECHTGFSEGNHPERTFGSKQEFSRQSSKACTNCHSGFTGIHKTMLEHEGTKAACSDCHRAHEVQPVAVAFSDTKYCIGCHRQNLALPMRDGETLGLAIETTHLEHSVHKGLNCSDCHFGFSSKEHPERSFQSKRDYTLAASETCRRCHFDKYTRTLESIHYQLLTEGRQDAPVCVDCHGAHGIATGRVEKIVNAKRCEQCHGAIYSIYKDSVHGAALISEHNQDVPVCSDCHRAHDISDPRTAEFHLTIPEICGNCHASPEIMDKYHLSTKVVDTYIQDFHGVTLRYYKREGDPTPIATCTDCHGIHDIAKTTDPGSPVVKANLVKRCQKCHAGATENFPDSWISHYESTFRKAPLVYIVNLIYKIFIPFMIVGLGLQILLHVWRYAINR